jgi:hypothetical protein
MSSEEMRIELEAFVNAGLREGWHGWPLKGQTGMRPAMHSRWYAAVGGTDRRDSTVRVVPLEAPGAVRLFDWEHRRIRAGARLVSHESRS